MASVINEAPQEKAEIPLFRKLSYSLTDFGGNVLFVSMVDCKFNPNFRTNLSA